MKALQRSRIFFQVFGQEFQGNVAAEIQVLRLINHTHPAPANLAQDAVVGNRLIKHLGRELRDENDGRRCLIPSQRSAGIVENRAMIPLPFVYAT